MTAEQGVLFRNIAPNGQLADQTYRWRLWRDVAATPEAREKGLRILWIMLNPSTADHATDDPTMRKVRHYSARAGYARADVTNLFAYRATDPDVVVKMMKAGKFNEAIGDRCDEIMAEAIGEAHAIAVAWGAMPNVGFAHRAKYVYQALIQPAEKVTLCLGYTRGTGDPRHPLMMANDTPLVEYQRRPHPLLDGSREGGNR